MNLRKRSTKRLALLILVVMIISMAACSTYDKQNNTNEIPIVDSANAVEMDVSDTEHEYGTDIAIRPDGDNAEPANPMQSLPPESSADILTEAPNSMEPPSYLYYQVADRYGIDGNPGYSELFESSDSLERLKSLNFDLKSNFDYYELQTQPLEYIGIYSGDDKFCRGDVNQRVQNSAGMEVIVTPLNTVMIGAAYFTNFNSCITSGRNFNSEDFYVSSAESEISILLGYEYMGVYDLDDVIELSLHQYSLKFRVVGFFKEDTKILYRQYGTISFDRSIIVPFYDIGYSPEDEADAFYQKVYYTQKNMGFIRIEEQDSDTIESVRLCLLEILEILVKKHNLVYTLTLSYSNISFNE